MIDILRLFRIVRRNKSRSSVRPRARRPRLELEILEARITPSSVDLTGSPQNIPIGVVQAGQTIPLKVNFSTTDSDDQSEGEPVIIQGSAGTSITVSNYASQTIQFPITQKGETISAYIQDADGDETATIQAPTFATIDLYNFIPFARVPNPPVPGFLVLTPKELSEERCDIAEG